MAATPTALPKKARGNETDVFTCVGRQYRTGIYYTNDADLLVIDRIMTEQESLFGQKLAVEVEPLDNYVLAEEYHQDYLKKNPGGYCHINVDDAYKPLT